MTVKDGADAGRVLGLELPWLQPLFGRLCEQMRGGRFPAAVLVASVAGAGGEELVRALSDALLCQASVSGSGGGTEVPCGLCKSCLLSRADTHPDRVVVMPEEKGKAIRVDQIRALNDFVYSRPQIGSRRVVILQPAEAMNLNASNALLKTLEEPAPDACLLLTSSSPARLLPTIRSRCFRVTPVIPEPAVARAWLLQHWPGEGLDRALLNAHGSPLLALEALRDGADLVRQEVIDEWKAFLGGSRDAFSVAEHWAKVDQDDLIDWMITALHAQARAPSLGLSEQKIHQLHGELLDIARGWSEKRNLNPALQWENWLMLCKSRR